MAILDLPALRSDDPLGFLAGLGLVELAVTGLGFDVRLGWDELGGPARIDAPVQSVDELAVALHELARQWDAEGRVVPPPDAGFIRKRLTDSERRARIEELGSKPPNDPMRMPLEAAVARFAEQRQREIDGDVTGARWLIGTVAQLAVVDKGAGGAYCDLTPLYAPAGQQTLFQLYEKYTRMVSESPRWIEEALLGWRRTGVDSGANLDRRDIRDATASASGGSENAGVPGATWLALQAVPFFRLVGNGRQGAAVGWIARPGGRPRTLSWPVWRPLLDRAAITVLLEHPATRPKSRADVDGPALESLGVVALLRAARRSAGNSDGPLQQPAVIWP